MTDLLDAIADLILDGRSDTLAKDTARKVLALMARVADEELVEAIGEAVGDVVEAMPHQSREIARKALAIAAPVLAARAKRATLNLVADKVRQESAKVTLMDERKVVNEMQEEMAIASGRTPNPIWIREAYNVALTAFMVASPNREMILCGVADMIDDLAKEARE